MIAAYFIGGPLDQTKMILNDDKVYHRALEATHMPRVSFPPEPPPTIVEVKTTDYRRLGPVTRYNNMDVYIFVVIEK